MLSGQHVDFNINVVSKWEQPKVPAMGLLDKNRLVPAEIRRIGGRAVTVVAKQYCL